MVKQETTEMASAAGGTADPATEEVRAPKVETKEGEGAPGRGSGSATGPGQGTPALDPVTAFMTWLPLGLPKGCFADISATWAAKFQGTYLGALGKWIAAWSEQTLTARRATFKELFEASTCLTYWADSLINLELGKSRPPAHLGGLLPARGYVHPRHLHV